MAVQEKRKNLLQMVREKRKGSEMTPFEFQLWDAQACAEYFGESKEYFLQHTRYKEGFPQEIPGKPKRWRALAVSQWALGLEEAA